LEIKPIIVLVFFSSTDHGQRTDTKNTIQK